ncbi:MAG: helix-turn-helix transcriptional regulator [Vicinamibacteria bacterium]
MTTTIQYQYTGERIVREKERQTITGLSRPAWYRLERAGLAPRRRPITERTVGWRLTELQRWVDLTLSGEQWTGTV